MFFLTQTQVAQQMDYLAYGLAGVALLYALVLVGKANAPNLDHIPTVGPSGTLTSYWGALEYFRNAQGMTLEGYRKHRNGVFKIANLHIWIIFCCNRSHIEDIRKAKDDELSLMGAHEETFQMTYTTGREVIDDPYHVPVVNPMLTRSLPAFFTAIHDEVVQYFTESITFNDNEWTAVSATKLAPKLVGRVVNRIFVGVPACRDPDYLDLNVEFTFDVVKLGAIIRCFPKFMRPFVGGYISKLPTHIKRSAKHVGPVLDAYLNSESRSENLSPEPAEFINWLWRSAPDQRRNLRDVILRILAINFGAIHTSSMSFSHALYHLAAKPEWAKMLREEVETIVSAEGWTKAALDQMVKLDSFLKESQRINGLGSTTLFRKAVKDFTFSDGTLIPAGATIAVPLYAVQHDESFYPDPDVFDPLRFLKLDGTAAASRQMTMPTIDYLVWGQGKHACPGRFMAVTVLKASIAHILASYDVKFAKEGMRPANQWVDGNCLPNMSAEVLFRKRRD